MATTPQEPKPTPTPLPSVTAPAPAKNETPPPGHHVHEVAFVSYPKLLFFWPLLLAGFVFWPLGKPAQPQPAAPAPAAALHAAPAAATPSTAPAAASSAAPGSHRLHVLGWLYLWVAVLVFLTLGVDVDRNQAAFWFILVAAIYILGMWLHDVKHFTLFGDVYRWFVGLNVQYDRSFGLALSILLLVPYLIMIGWGRFNDRWRITHNEFEHFAFGRLDDSLGRGAKTIRSSYPDMFELLIGLAGTLVVYNATGTQELRRIPHVMLLPFVRKRLNRILETTSVTASQTEDEEDDDNQP